MGKIFGSKVLQQAEREVKKKTLKKTKTKSIIKLSKESKPEEKPKYTLEKQDDEEGIVYLGHIPHGFYEEQIKEYFKQFGSIIKVRVARSKKSGRSKGYAFILFKDVSVAKVAADAMNNYLMCGRLIKAHFVPKEKQNLSFFLGKNYHQSNYPKLFNVKKTLHRNRRPVKKTQVERKNKIVKKKFAALEDTLKSKGINLSLTFV